MKKTDNATPNHLLRSERKLRCWTQSQVAEQLGTTNVNVNRWESGLTFPSLYFRQKLCELFGKSAAELGLIPETERQEQAAVVASSSFPELWNVPFRRNPFFTGREEVLTHLHEALKVGRVLAVAQTQAISGLGGIGKTQTVVEYAYRHYRDYSAILWVKADSRELLTADIVELARLLHLPEQDEQEQSRAVAGVKRWLNEHNGWLLILDNVEDVELASDFLPATSKGHILLTTRASTTGAIAQRIELQKMQPEEGALFLLHRTKRINPHDSLEHASPVDRTKAQELSHLLDGLPLALDQAGAYIEETDCGFSGYLNRYQTRRAALLKLRGTSGTDHPEPVATTWSLSFEQLQQANPVAADLLRLCAFLHPDAIPEEIFTEGASELGATLGPVAADPLALDVAIRDLRKFSLARRDPEAQLLMVHRLVQAVLKDSMGEQTQHQWAERTVRAVNRAFPEVEFATWQRCHRCLPHAQACASLVEQWDLTLAEATQLLKKAGFYLQERGWYKDAEPLYQRVLAIDGKALEPEHPEVATDLTNLARLYYDQGQYVQAEPLFQRALAIREQQLGPEHLLVAENLTNLGVLYTAQGKHAQAEPLFQQALAIREQQLGPEHPDIAESLSNLGGLYGDQGQYARAEPLWKRALAIREQQLGPEHPQTARSFHNLALLYRLQGKYAQAEPLFQRALAIWEEQLAPEHPYIAICLHNLAALYTAQGRYAQAESLFQRALATYERQLVSQHPLVAECLNDLARLYYEQGKYTQAEPLIKRALRIFEQVKGPEDSDTTTTLHNLARIYRVQGKYEQAKPLFQRALAIRKQVLGLEHPHVAEVLEDYTDLLREMKRKQVAATREGRVK